jgi:hypothetical protein
MNVWIRFLSGGLVGSTRTLRLHEGGSAQIGRADDNDIALTDADVAASSHHAQIAVSGGALFLYDLGSTNGTWIAGQKVQQAALPSGTRVTFGRGGPEAEVIWQTEATAAAPAAAPPKTAPGFAGFGGAPPAAAAPPPGTKTAPGFAGFGGAPPATLPAAASPDAASQHHAAVHDTKPQAFVAVPALPSPEHMPQAYQEAAPQPSAASDTCGMCGSLLFFICYQCRRTLCGSHYEPSTGVCVECAGAPAATAPRPAVGAGEDEGLPARRRKPAPVEDDMALPPRRRSGPGAGGPPADDALPPRRRAGPPADDELPPRRRRPQ